MMPDALTGKLFRHIKSGGLYRVTGTRIIESTYEIGIDYENVITLEPYNRPAKEFFDGRFILFNSRKENVGIIERD